MILVTSVLCLAAAATLAQSGNTTEFTFPKDSIGKLPPGWKSAQTGKGEGSVWKIVADDTAPSKTGHVLAQTATSPRNLFNLCVTDRVKGKNVEISVMFKAVAGKIDQGGGIVWRYQDNENYYVARMNPEEDNYRVYKLVKGQRIQLDTKEDVVIEAGKWHELKIKHAGAKIECFLNGKKLLEAEDDAISGAGFAGLWTKADAQTYFDLFRVKSDMGNKD